MERLSFIFAILFSLLFIFLAGARIYEHNVNAQEVNVDLTTTTLLINWFDTEQELQNALNDNSIAGFSECELRPDFNTSFCELWLVYPHDATDNYAYDTIGHELYHALKGDFHD